MDFSLLHRCIRTMIGNATKNFDFVKDNILIKVALLNLLPHICIFCFDSAKKINICLGFGLNARQG